MATPIRLAIDSIATIPNNTQLITPKPRKDDGNPASPSRASAPRRDPCEAPGDRLPARLAGEDWLTATDATSETAATAG